MLIAIVVIAAVGAVCVGPVRLAPAAVVYALLHPSLGASDATSSHAGTILWQIRLPRVLLEILIGAALGAAGVAFQALLRNDLAEPYTTGVSSGSAVGAAIVIVCGLETTWNGLLLPLAALAGGLATLWIVYQLAVTRGEISARSLLLAGVVAGAFLWSTLSFLLLSG
jgi:iron complex transport system permease protein